MQVVINKKDLVTPAQLHEVSMAAARATRKGARLLHCQRGQVARVRARASARATATATVGDRDRGGSVGDARTGIMARVMAWLLHCQRDPVRSVVTLAVTSARPKLMCTSMPARASPATAARSRS